MEVPEFRRYRCSFIAAASQTEFIHENAGDVNQYR